MAGIGSVDGESLRRESLWRGLIEALIRHGRQRAFQRGTLLDDITLLRAAATASAWPRGRLGNTLRVVRERGRASGGGGAHVGGVCPPHRVALHDMAHAEREEGGARQLEDDLAAACDADRVVCEQMLQRAVGDGQSFRVAQRWGFFLIGLECRELVNVGQVAAADELRKYCERAMSRARRTLYDSYGALLGWDEPYDSEE